MNAALLCPNTPPFTCRTWHCLIGLMAVTGLRVSEAVGLRLGDFTEDGLVVRNAKFGKTRLLPLHPSTRRALDAYLAGRLAVPGSGDALFVTAAGNPPTTGNVRKMFIAAGRRCGLRGEPGTAGPRLHDLRHGFAVRALERLPDDADVGRHTLALSTYLGHANLLGTYWYLEATPTIMRGIAHRIERMRPGEGTMTAIAPACQRIPARAPAECARRKCPHGQELRPCDQAVRRIRRRTARTAAGADRHWTA